MNMKNIIYADNAATTKLDLEAFEAMKPYLLEEYGNPSQPYFFSKKAKLAMKNARYTIAECINAEPEQIFFTSGGTESDNWVIKEYGFPADDKTIITSEIEHHAILNSCGYMKDAGRATINYIPVDSEGVVNKESLENALVASGSSKLVSIMLANNEIGTIQNIKDLCRISHGYGAAFHTDAVQAVGHIPIDVKELGVDFLSASAHKFNGPRGIGFLYSSGKKLLTPYHSGGMQESGKRAGTENVAAIVGMAKALENNCKKIEANANYITMLEEDFINRISDLEFVRNGAPEHLPGNISLSFSGYEGEQLLHRLDLMGIAVSTGSACDSVNTQTSHVLKAIGLSENLAVGTIRISLGKNNSMEDVIKLSDALHKILQEHFS